MERCPFIGADVVGVEDAVAGIDDPEFVGEMPEYILAPSRWIEKLTRTEPAGEPASEKPSGAPASE
jgi:hypothetical protein